MREPKPLPCKQCGYPVSTEAILAETTSADTRPSFHIRTCTNSKCRSQYFNRPERDKP